jgi:alkylation response protein AidB-like acyl-CoA dehydrogenase
MAIRDESIPGWRLTGQKVWTSYATFARWGICLARTDAEVQPRHAGISYLVVDMEQPGIEVRPLRQITGESEFNEVFLDDVVVPDHHLIGPLHGGWAVANTTLAHERGTAFPFKEQVVHEQFVDDLWREAAAGGRLDDVVVADGLAQSWLEVRLLRLHNWRTLTRLARGEQPGPESSLVKLAWTDATQHLSAVALDVLGPAGSVEGPWARQWLWSKAASIAGGTSEIQKTIIADRILGLPR